jgi:hypothetical protein
LIRRRCPDNGALVQPPAAKVTAALATIHPLSEVDPALVEDFRGLAFEPERKRHTAYKVREGTECLAALSFAALDEGGHLCGTIQCWPVALTDPVKDGKIPPSSTDHSRSDGGATPPAEPGRWRRADARQPERDEPAGALAAGHDRQSRVL